MGGNVLDAGATLILIAVGTAVLWVVFMAGLMWWVPSIAGDATRKMVSNTNPPYFVEIVSIEGKELTVKKTEKYECESTPLTVGRKTSVRWVPEKKAYWLDCNPFGE